MDIDPVAVAESLEILAGNEHVTAILGDLLEPQAILDHPQVRDVLDFDRPIAWKPPSRIQFGLHGKPYFHPDEGRLAEVGTHDHLIRATS